MRPMRVLASVLVAATALVTTSSAAMAAVPTSSSMSATAAPSVGESVQDLPPVYRTIAQRQSSATTVKTGTTVRTCSAPVGDSCTISYSTDLTRTMDLSLGLTRGTVGGTLGISSSTTQGVSVSCNVTIQRSGQYGRAVPRGTTYKYIAIKQRAFAPYRDQDYREIQRSGTLSAFNPTGLACLRAG